jgi:hypothetical protein
MKTVYVKGSEIYKAAVAGAKRGYNRSTDNYASYEDALSESFSYFVSTIGNRAARRSVMKKTKGSWKEAYLPLSLAMIHTHIGGEVSEPHARVYLLNDPHVFDIPLTDWEEFAVTSDELLSSMDAVH